jgi:hypothetical protein
MTMRRIVLAALAAAATVTVDAAAQTGPFDCPSFGGASCRIVQQGLHSAVPQVGIAAAGGNPLLGTASVGGLRLGFLPRVTGSLRVTAARTTLPDFRANDFDDINRQRTALVPSVDVDAAVSAFSGLSSGTVGGIGSLDVLLSGGVLPGGGLEGTGLAWGAGLRVGLLREGFGTPAVNVSGMYRRVESVQYGSACAAAPCTSGTLAQFDFAVRDLSARATVGKRVARVGLLGGVGYDRFHAGDAEITYSNGTTANRGTESVNEGRWSVFGNLSYALPVGALTIEGGWMSGGSAIPEYPDVAKYDPGTGTVFGSFALRVAL